MTNNYAEYIDHTLLKPDAKKEEIDQLLAEAKEFEFASVCVNPIWVRYCKEILKETSVKVCTVIGFPLGAVTTETKVFETKKAIGDGATEVDMVIAIGSLKSGDNEYVERDIQEVVNATNNKAITKVIIETALLTKEEKITACKLAKKAGANYVKTSTGFSTAGATIEDVRLMRQVVGQDIGVKASGGIRNLITFKEMIDAGASRIGASAGVQILEEARN